MKSVGKKFEVNDALLKQLDEGTVKWDELDRETFDAAGALLDKNEDTEVEAAPGETPAAQPAAAPIIQGNQDDPAKTPKGFVEGSRYKETADKASDFENKWKAEQKRRLELEEKLKTKDLPPIEAPDASKVWTDEHQVGLSKTVLELQRELESYRNERKGTLEADREHTLEIKNELELNMLRSNPVFKGVAPEMTMAQMESVYSDFYYATGATAEDASPVKKFFEDANFRKDLETRGVKAPKDFEKINTILQAKALRDKYAAVDPDIKLSDAYVNLMAKSNKLSTMLTDERLKGAAQVADKLHGIANETITMQPGLTSGATTNEWSDAQMSKWMDEHPSPKTKEEEETFKRIEAILDARDQAAASY